MTMEQMLAADAATAGADSREPFSVAWWQSRTPEELRDIINRGFAGGPEFKGAVAEVERRAREETRRLRELAAAEAARRKKRNRIMFAMAFTGTAVATLLGYWLGR